MPTLFSKVSRLWGDGGLKDYKQKTKGKTWRRHYIQLTREQGTKHTPRLRKVPRTSEGRINGYKAKLKAKMNKKNRNQNKFHTIQKGVPGPGAGDVNMLKTKT